MKENNDYKLIEYDNELDELLYSEECENEVLYWWKKIQKNLKMKVEDSYQALKFFLIVGL